MKPVKRIPFEWVTELLFEKQPVLKPMFGAFAVYVGEKIVFMLRDKPQHPEDNGVWVATVPDHHLSLAREIPSLRSIALFGPEPSGWQVIPADSPAFEEEVTHACSLVLKNDARIGKIPLPRKKKKTQ